MELNAPGFSFFLMVDRLSADFQSLIVIAHFVVIFDSAYRNIIRLYMLMNPAATSDP